MKTNDTDWQKNIARRVYKSRVGEGWPPLAAMQNAAAQAGVTVADVRKWVGAVC